VKCWSCGLEITALSEVRGVYQLGLSLQGECPNCGARLGVNSLWRKRYEQKLAFIAKTHSVDYVIGRGTGRGRTRFRQDAKNKAKSGRFADGDWPVTDIRNRTARWISDRELRKQMMRMMQAAKDKENS